MDKEAREEIYEAQRLKEEQKAQIARDRDKVQEQYLARANQRIDKVKAFNAQEATSRGLTMEEQYQLCEQQLTDTFQSNKERWIEELFSRCISG